VTPAGATVTYQWSRLNTSTFKYDPIIGANERTYTLKDDDVGKNIEVTVTGIGSYIGAVTSDYLGPVMSAEYTAVSSIGDITGELEVGSTLTAGAVAPAGATVTYQWRRWDSLTGPSMSIPGATGQQYVATSADQGKYLRVTVFGTGLYIGFVTSGAAGPITDSTVIGSIGNITGSLKVGSTLTAGLVLPTEATVTYQWQRGDSLTGSFTNISGATGQLYILVAADYGKYLRVTVTGMGSFTGTATSSAVGPVTAGTLIKISSIGDISGRYAVGSLLTAGTVTPEGATVTYRWQCGDSLTGPYTNISGATEEHYVPTSADFTKYLRVTVKGTGLYSGTVISSAIGPITTDISMNAYISGDFLVGTTLTAVTVLPAGATFTYQWQRTDYYSGTYSDIEGATGLQYVLTSADFGKYIRVTATGTGLYSGTASSFTTGPVRTPETTAITSIEYSYWNMIVGSTLTAGAVHPLGATVTYQWQRAYNGVSPYTNIEGATGSTYTIRRCDVGYALRVVATGTGSFVGSVVTWQDDTVYPVLINCALGLTYNTTDATVSMTIHESNSTTSAVTADFIIAAFNSSGKLLTVQTISGVTIAVRTEFTQAVTLACGSVSGSITVKIFAFEGNSGYIPISYPWSGST
jgi:hypothetical protein